MDHQVPDSWRPTRHDWQMCMYGQSQQQAGNSQQQHGYPQQQQQQWGHQVFMQQSWEPRAPPQSSSASWISGKTFPALCIMLGYSSHADNGHASMHGHT